MPTFKKTIMELAEFMRDEGRVSEEQLKKFKKKVRRDEIITFLIIGLAALVFISVVVLKA